MRTFIASLALGLLTTLFAVLPAHAAGTSCQPIYGGGQTCIQTGNVAINKMVLNPQTNTLVENLNINDPKYNPEQLVTFQLTVTNTSNATLARITVRDVFPVQVNYISGVGNFDAGSRALSFEVNNLGPNESRSFTLSGKVVSANQLPVDQGVVCVVNQATATADSNASMDTAQLCIQKLVSAQAPTVPQQLPTKGGLKVFPPPSVTTTPPTGPEALSLIAMIPTGALGYFIRKRAGLIK